MDRNSTIVVVIACFCILIGMVSCSEAIKPRPAPCLTMPRGRS